MSKRVTWGSAELVHIRATIEQMLSTGPCSAADLSQALKQEGFRMPSDHRPMIARVLLPMQAESRIRCVNPASAYKPGGVWELVEQAPAPAPVDAIPFRSVEIVDAHTVRVTLDVVEYAKLMLHLEQRNGQ